MFVGGVPQDLNQDDLYAIFSEYAGVKKAWLQKCRTADDGSGNSTCPPQNHRGFGFVIFHDAHAIDELLGSGPSRFIILRSGAKLEVKRALSSNKMGQESAAAGGSQAVGRNGRGHQPHQSLRGSGPTAADLPSNHIVGSASGQARSGAVGGQAGGLRGSGARNNLGSTGPSAAAAAAAVAAGQAFGGRLAQGHTAAAADPAFAQLEALQAARISAAAAYGAALSGPHHLAATLGPPGQGQSAQLREAVVRFYHTHCPEKLTEHDLIDCICSAYEGREAELDAALRQKYGMGLNLSMRKAPPGFAPTPPLPGGGRGRPRTASTGTDTTASSACYTVGEPAYAPTTNAEAWRFALAASGGRLGLSGAAAPFGATATLAPTHPAVSAALAAASTPAGRQAAAAAAAARAARPYPAMSDDGSDPETAVGKEAYLGAPGMLPSWMDAETMDSVGLGAYGLPAPGLLGDHYAPHSVPEPEGPDFSWVSRIVDDSSEGLELPEDVARALVGKSATSIQRKDYLPANVVW